MIELKYFGHSTFLVEIEGKSLLYDPFISPNSLASDIEIDKITADFVFGNVKYVNAVHSSSHPDGSYGGNPGGYVIASNQGTFYYAGDTALSYDMKLIGDSFDIDFAILPIGDNFTMGITDALIAAEFVGTDKIIGMHYDTFAPIEINKKAAKSEAEKSGKELILLNIGESISL